MSSIRDADINLWLHNKLGQSDDHWSGKIICPHLNANVIIKASQNFESFQPQVKMRLLLSILHLSRRNVEEWQAELQELVNVASVCSDPWCKSLANLLKDYPKTGCIDSNDSNFLDFFSTLVNDVENVNTTITNSLLPLESAYLSKNALYTLTGFQSNPIKYFALKRKPKSAILRAELLQKSSEALIQGKSKNPMASLIPFKEKLSNKIEHINALANNTRDSHVAANNKSGMIKTVKKESGRIKLLDLSEQPLANKDIKKRRKIDDPIHSLPSNVKDTGMSQAYTFSHMGLVNKGPYPQSNLLSYDGQLTEAPSNNPLPPHSPYMNAPHPQDTSTSFQDFSNPALKMNYPGTVQLSQEQIIQAQEIFQDANRVTAPEKSLILGFMSGLRENPCPNQGETLSIKLSENVEEVLIPSQLETLPPTKRILIAQIFFQMNYQTGEWKRIKSYRLPEPDEIRFVSAS